MARPIRLRDVRRLVDGGDTGTARPLLARLVATRPDNPAVLHLAAYAAHLSGEHEEAARLQARLVALAPEHPEAGYNLALYLSRAERRLEALGIVMPLALRKDATPTALRLAGNLLMESGQFPDAARLFNRALKLDPTFHACAFDMAKCLARTGRFADALRFYESRKKLFAVRPKTHLTPWDGAGVPERLHVFAEQGLGDFLMFMRYLRHEALAQTELSVAIDAKLHRLAGPALPGIDLLPRDHPGPGDGVHCAPVMSLPFLLGLSGEALGMAAPYLAPEPDLADRWRRLLGGKRGIAVGLVWQGNPDGRVDQGRSVPLACLEPLCRLNGIRRIALQKHDGLDQLEAAAFAKCIERPPEPFDDGPDAFADTAAIMAGLDLVITVDTATAHLAGALGVPCWVLLKRLPDWRWGAATADSIWYPSVTLYRQQVDGDWDAPVAAITRDLLRMGRSRA